MFTVSKEELKSENFFRLYNGAQQRIHAYLLMMVHNYTDAEDLLQETASILWEKFEEFDKSRSFAAWSIGIARNKALDLLKSRRRSRAFFKDGFYDEISEIEEAEHVNAHRRLKALRECIKKMSIPNQNLVRLRFEQGLPVKKISQKSGHSVDAIYKRLSRVYAALQECVSRTLAQWETV